MINMSISFVNIKTKDVICYIGSCTEMYRYQANVQTNILEVPSKKRPSKADECLYLVALLSNIDEFKQTSIVHVEKQPGVAKKEMCRLDGIIFGFMGGMGIECVYVDARVRVSYAISEFERIKAGNEANTEELFKASKTSIKSPSIALWKEKYPLFYAYIIELDLKKIDDIADSIVYADMRSK